MATVLLVEDVPVVRMTLMKFLERGGHVVTVCGGGGEAWSCVNRNRFDAVVTDLWMMNGDGLQLIQRMRTKGDLTPVIAITGGDPRSSQSTSVDVALRAGQSGSVEASHQSRASGDDPRMYRAGGKDPERTV